MDCKNAMLIKCKDKNNEELPMKYAIRIAQQILSRKKEGGKKRKGDKGEAFQVR